jgi:predicted flap endonuclease-1-like 5' DNA nuclease
MDTFIILLAQTRGVAIIEILSLLLVAAIIGYITSWLYHKSIYVKNLKAIESERDELKNQITHLAAEKSKLKKEVHALEALRTKTVPGAEDEALVHIARGKHLLNYTSFGTADASEKDDLSMISGIGPFIEERLHALDIYTFRQISKFSALDIKMISDSILFFSGRIERDEWVAQARELVRDEKQRMESLKRIKARKNSIYYDRIGIARKEEADDLTVISGIGGWIKEKLNALSIYTFRQIGNFNEEDVHSVTEAIEYFPGRIERDEWILQAQELNRIAGKKSELLERIRERKDRIYFDRLGIAKKFEADNLTLINGIGLWIEERLNILEIYSFDQISKLSSKDVETITEILEIFPGRIQRDNWIGQAQELAKIQNHKQLV